MWTKQQIFTHCSVVVSDPECGSEGPGFESHPSHVGYVSADWLLFVTGIWWKGRGHTANLDPFQDCVFEGVAFITGPTLQVLPFSGQLTPG